MLRFPLQSLFSPPCCSQLDKRQSVFQRSSWGSNYLSDQLRYESQMPHQRKFQSVCTTSRGLTHCLFLVTPVAPLTEAGYKGWLMMGQGFPGGSGKEPVCLMQETQETQVQSLGWENPLEEGVATHSSILAWRISWTKEPSGLQSVGLLRVKQD